MSLQEAMAEQDVLEDLGLHLGPCEGSRFHSPTPLGTRQVDTSHILDEKAPHRVASRRMIYLCSTCLDNLRVYLTLCIASNGALPWEVRRDFGNVIRRIGQEIWSTHYEERRG